MFTTVPKYMSPVLNVLWTFNIFSILRLLHIIAIFFSLKLYISLSLLLNCVLFYLSNFNSKKKNTLNFLPFK